MDYQCIIKNIDMGGEKEFVICRKDFCSRKGAIEWCQKRYAMLYDRCLGKADEDCSIIEIRMLDWVDYRGRAWTLVWPDKSFLDLL